MKALKIAGISILSILVLLVIVFTLVLPNVVNPNNYKQMIYDAVKDASGLELSISDIKILPSLTMKVSVEAKDIKIDYPDKKNLLTLERFRTDISILPILFKTLKIDKVELYAPKINISMKSNGKYDIEEYLAKNLKQSENQEMPIKLSDNLPKVFVSNYKISIKDSSQGQTYSVSGEKFDITELVLNKKIALEATGKLSTEKKDHIIYDIKAESFLPDMTKTVAAPLAAKDAAVPIAFNPLKSISDYDIESSIKADVRVTQKSDDIYIKGFANIGNISYNITGTKVPDSNIKLTFNKNKTNIDSKLQLGKSETANIKGVFVSGRKPLVDLKVNSEKITLNNIKQLGIALLAIGQVPNDLKSFNVTGYLVPDFSLKSNLKKIESEGKLNLYDGAISHKSIPLNINNINSNLDFSNNIVKIKKATANVNGSPINVQGQISTDAVADISLTANNIALAPLLAAMTPIEMRKAYEFKSGSISATAYVKGRLDKILPKADVKVKNLSIYDKINKMSIRLPYTSLEVSTSKKDVFAKGSARNLQISLSDPKITISAINPTIEANSNDIKILPSEFRLNSSPIRISGEVKNYPKNLKANILAKGSINTFDLKNMLPAETKSMINNSGSLPMIAVISSDGKTSDINLQVAANPSNFITPLDLKEHYGKYSILNLSASMRGDSVYLNDLKLYYMNQQNRLTEDMGANLKGASSTASISGTISDISRTPRLNNVKVTTGNLSASIPGYKNSYASVKTNLNINGNIASPQITGDIAVPSFNIPTMSTNGENIDLKFSSDSITAKVPRIAIKNSQLALNAVLDANLGPKMTVNNLELSSPNLDLDEITAIFANMESSSISPAPSVPININNGKLNITNFKMGAFKAQDIQSALTLKNNVVKISNMTANAYTGSVAGNIEYNLPYELVSIKMTGQQLDSAPVIQALTGMKDVAQGKMNFNAKVSMRGSKPEQQMKSLSGECDFNISNGQVGAVATLEHFLYAQNLISQRLVSSTITQTAKAVMPKQTGRFTYLKGDMTFSNGYANISPIQMSGSSMSFYLTGTLNLLNNHGNLEFLGRLNQEIVAMMGPISDLSVQGLLNNVPKFGSTISSLLNTYNAEATVASLNKIPQLTPSAPSKSFKVNLNGNLQSPTAVKSFKWLSTQEEINASKSQLLKQLLPGLTTDSGATGGSTSPIKIPVPEKIQKPLNILKEFMPQDIKPQTTAPQPQKKPSFAIPDFINNLPD